MKKQLHDWEADLRQKVEQHEFDFEPQAWAEMEQLLEQASPGGSGSGASVLKGLWWKIGLSVFIGMAIALITLQWYPEEAGKPKPELSSFSIPVPRPAEKAEENIKVPALNPLPTSIKPPLPIGLSARSMEGMTPLPPVRDRIEPFEQLPTSAVNLQQESTYFEKPDWQPPAPRRKRDRKKLFPDVIERNKK